MDIHNRQERKSYAMQRMSAAIDRAMRSSVPAEKRLAMRWAAAWGLVAGIRSSSARLRDTRMLRNAGAEPPRPEK